MLSYELNILNKIHLDLGVILVSKTLHEHEILHLLTLIT